MISVSNKSLERFSRIDIPEKNFINWFNRPKSFSSDECHMFYPVTPCIEHIVATALKYTLFHPSDEEMSVKFQVDKIYLKGSENEGVLWCHFPKEHKEACENIGKVFNMKMVNKSQAIFLSNEVVLRSQESSNVLCFEGPRLSNQDQIRKQCKDLKDMKAFL